ncbi:uncharacterized protein LOC110702992 [Chenopodium quinoa]|uniref:uncharacterized protein LOC110702992 n=1 Tax=Chenopodium quinoa TaxID=63459 RepID=UPI000B797967|nr:uncharacterized protein LOC110702992 [Chenopodium quinoa]
MADKVLPRHSHIEVVIQQAVNLVGEFEKANEISLTPLSSNHWAAQTWEAPPLGVCKINSDVACFRDASTGLGCVVRDHVGDVLLSTCWRSREEYDVDIGEALAARHSLSISLEAGFRKVILETDNLKLLQHVKHRKTQCTSFGLIVKDILYLADSCVFFYVSQVGRMGNGVAHRLAKASIMYDVMRVWMEEVPECAADAVLQDILSLS